MSAARAMRVPDGIGWQPHVATATAKITDLPPFWAPESLTPDQLWAEARRHVRGHIHENFIIARLIVLHPDEIGIGLKGDLQHVA